MSRAPCACGQDCGEPGVGVLRLGGCDFAAYIAVKIDAGRAGDTGAQVHQARDVVAQDRAALALGERRAAGL